MAVISSMLKRGNIPNLISAEALPGRDDSMKTMTNAKRTDHFVLPMIPP
jgi:hypothetical protein